MAGGGDGKRRTGRSYRPVVEAMEALRLLSSAAPAASLPGLAAEHNLLPDATSGIAPLASSFPTVSSETWDAALVETHLTDMLSSVGTAVIKPSTASISSIDDWTTVSSGLSQLNKYLSRAWHRAGVPPQQHDDCTQAVYTTLLQHLGRDRFDALVSDIGHSGIKDVFTRETNEGVAFFRAVDMVKKRAQRERTYQSLDTVDVPSPTRASESRAWHDALREAIDHTLSPREASLINETLMGKTPAEIAHVWGVAPKTISNEKTRVIQKLRDALLTQAGD